MPELWNGHRSEAVVFDVALYQHVLLARVPQGQQWGVLHDEVLGLVI